MKKFMALCLCLSLLLLGCGREVPKETGGNGLETLEKPGETGPAQVSPPQELSAELFSDRDYRTSYEADTVITLEGNSVSVSGNGAAVAGTTVTLSGEGTYVIRGTLDNGQLIVDTDKENKVQLVLENAHIHSDTSAPLYIRQADKVFVTLPEGTENTLSSGETYAAVDDNNIDAALFSKEDLTMNGSGSLLIRSPGGHGIVSKDEMTLTGGNITVQCSGHGISGKDNICIDGARLTIQSGKDGIQCDNDEDTSLGFVYILSGSFQIEAEGDGISASSQMAVYGGSFDIETGGGYENGETHTSENWGQMGGMGGGPGGMGGRPGGMGDRPGSMPGGNQGTATESTEDSASIKGLKAGSLLEVFGGDFELNCADDAVHANGDVTVSGGSFRIKTGDDGFHADGALSVSHGAVTVSESYEGLEGQTIAISGGDISVKSGDDGLNAAGGADQSGFGGFRGADMFAADANSCIVISGGTLFVDASGDGIDSNGDLTISGGDITVEGPTDGGNGPLDYGGNGKISGGTVRITGSVQMAQTLQGDGQGVLGVSVGNQSAGTAWEILDSKGNTVLSGNPQKAYSCIVASSPELIAGETYILKVGTLSGEIQAG